MGVHCPHPPVKYNCWLVALTNQNYNYTLIAINEWRGLVSAHQNILQTKILINKIFYYYSDNVTIIGKLNNIIQWKRFTNIIDS